MLPALVPKKFFVVKGKGISTTSVLNAFDEALTDAGIQNCNLVPVSSILPRGAQEIQPFLLPAARMTFCVLARVDIDNKTKERDGSAGLVYTASTGDGYGFVAEDHGYYDEKRCRETLSKKLKEACEVRKVNLKEEKYKVQEVRVPNGKCGCAIACLVYIF